LAEREEGVQAKTISLLMALTLIGKVLGLLRERLLAVNYGSGMEASAFLTASQIPRLFFDVVFASAISACFIPVFSEVLTQKGRKDAFRLGSLFLTVMLLLAAILSAAGMAFAEPLAQLFSDTTDAEALALTAKLTRMLFPTALFTAAAFSFVGLLQSLGNFHVPALISAVSNGVVIGYYLLFNERFGMMGLAVAFLIGWFLQAAVQVPSLYKLGYRYEPRLTLKDEHLKKMFLLMPSVMVSTWVQPINSSIATRYGWGIFDGAGVNMIGHANNLYLVITGVLVLSITNVLFPKLSRLTAAGNESAFDDTLRGSLRGCLFLVFPMTAGLVIVAEPLISLVFGGGAYSNSDVVRTAECLAAAALGMTGFAVQNILSRAYFAKQQGKIPLLAGAVSIGANLLLCQLWSGPFEARGLALAASVSAGVYALLLLLPLQRRGGALLNRTLLSALLRMAAAAVMMAVPTWFVMRAVSGLVAGKIGLVLTLAVTAAVGGSCYGIAAWVLRLDEVQAVLTAIKRKRGGDA